MSDLASRLRGTAALAVVDMQNDFCAPAGFVGRVMGKDVADAATIVPNIAALLERARAARIPVVWIRADYSRDRVPASMRLRLERRGIAEDCCVPGTWGFDWYGVAPHAGEPVVTKHNYDAFVGTDLEARLAAMRVRTLVVAGVQTQICVESAVRHAHAIGLDCIVPRDAVASHTRALHEATLANIAFVFGEVCDTADVLGAWSS